MSYELVQTITATILFSMTFYFIMMIFNQWRN